MAKRKPLVYIAGEAVEQLAGDTLEGNNIVVTADGSEEERPLSERFADIVNVKDFGAVGDGVADDTEAFKAAAAKASQTGGVVYVPHGLYKLTEEVPGEFISFGHPVFTGTDSIAITDLYNDYVHKTKNVNESVTGTKTFAESPLVPTPAKTDSSKKAVNTEWLRSIIGPGLGTNSDGEIMVDFSQADNSQEIQDTLDALMQAMHLPKWVKSSMHFYVDNSGIGQDTDDGEYGRSEAKPWATLRYALETITQNYNVNSKIIYIHMHAGTYEQTQSLPLAAYSRTTGAIVIAPYHYNDVVTITYSSSTGTLVSHTGGRWIFEKINFRQTILENTSSGSLANYIVLSTSGSKSELVGFRRCNFEYVDQTSSSSSNSSAFVGIYSNGGNIAISNMTLSAPNSPFISDYNNTAGGSPKAVPVSTLKGSKNANGNISTAYWYQVDNGGSLTFSRSGNADNRAYFSQNYPEIQVSGSCDVFLYVTTNGVVSLGSQGNAPVFTPATGFTGKKYTAAYGGSIRNIAASLPGDTAGTPEPTATDASVTVS